jgi:hypothetical protein
LSVIERVRDIAEEAYIFAYPMLVSYRAVHAIALDPSSPSFRAPCNAMASEAKTLGPSWRQAPSPNADTLLSLAGIDLSVEPVVVSVPAIHDRYYVVQMIDLFGMNAHFIGTRTTGCEAGHYLLVGPETPMRTPPEGIKAVLPFDTSLGVLVTRTEMKSEADIVNARAIQQQFDLKPLSAFTNRRPPAPPAEHGWMSWDESAMRDERFIGLFNHVLSYCRMTDRREQDLVQRCAAIGISPGAPFDAERIEPHRRAAILEGVTAARTRIATRVEHLADSVRGWQRTDAYGDREFFAGDDLLRAAGAANGFSGADRAESYYIFGRTDGDGEPLDGKLHDYTMRFETPPPARAFWSITMYDTSQDGSVGYLVENPLNRYRVGSMSDHLMIEGKALTITMSHEEPERGPSNWLPAPLGSFYIVLRLYIPDTAALDDSWLPPPIGKIDES